MDENSCEALLVEAAMLITATRVRIARSLALLGSAGFDGSRHRATDACVSGIVSRRSTHPPSSPSA